MATRITVDAASVASKLIDEDQTYGADLRDSIAAALERAKDQSSQTFLCVLIALTVLFRGSPRRKGGQQEWREITDGVEFVADFLADVAVVDWAFRRLRQAFNKPGQIPDFKDDLQGFGIDFRTLRAIFIDLFYVQQKGFVSGLPQCIESIDQDAVLEIVLTVFCQKYWTSNGAFVSVVGDSFQRIGSGTSKTFVIDPASVLVGQVPNGAVVFGTTEAEEISDVVIAFTRCDGDVNRACNGEQALLIGFWRKSDLRFVAGSIGSQNQVDLTAAKAKDESVPEVPGIPAGLEFFTDLRAAHSEALEVRRAIVEYDETMVQRTELAVRIAELERAEVQIEEQIVALRRQLEEASLARRTVQNELGQLPVIDPSFSRARELTRLGGLIDVICGAKDLVGKLRGLLPEDSLSTQ